MTKEHLTKDIEAWLKDYELATDETIGDVDTFDGSAYNIFQNVLGYLNK